MSTATGRPTICLGYWQSDGTWADADLGPGAAGLEQTISAAIERTYATVTCQSFSGTCTPSHHYNASSPNAEGPLRLPTDPDLERPGWWRGVDDDDAHDRCPECGAPIAERAHPEDGEFASCLACGEQRIARPANVREGDSGRIGV